MNGPEFVEQFVSLLRGNDLEIGDNIVRMPHGNRLSLTLTEEKGDLDLKFTGEIPVVEYYGPTLKIYGMRLCIKGVKLDAEWVPDKFDPFFSWDKLGLGGGVTHMPRETRNLTMQTALTAKFGRGKFFHVRNKLLSEALKTAELNQDLPKDELKKLLKKNLRAKLKRSEYGAIPWMVIIWWVLPTLIEWFLKEWVIQRTT